MKLKQNLSVLYTQKNLPTFNLTVPFLLHFIYLDLVFNMTLINNWENLVDIFKFFLTTKRKYQHTATTTVVSLHFSWASTIH